MDSLLILKNCSKCLRFLGHYIDPNGIRPIETKVQDITEFPKPQSTPNCAYIIHPLPTLLKANELTWNEEAFKDINVCLAKATTLSHPKLGSPTSIYVRCI